MLTGGCDVVRYPCRRCTSGQHVAECCLDTPPLALALPSREAAGSLGGCLPKMLKQCIPASCDCPPALSPGVPKALLSRFP